MPPPIATPHHTPITADRHAAFGALGLATHAVQYTHATKLETGRRWHACGSSSLTTACTSAAWQQHVVTCPTRPTPARPWGSCRSSWAWRNTPAPGPVSGWQCCWWHMGHGGGGCHGAHQPTPPLSNSTPHVPWAKQPPAETHHPSEAAQGGLATPLLHGHTSHPPHAACRLRRQQHGNQHTQPHMPLHALGAPAPATLPMRPCSCCCMATCGHTDRQLPSCLPSSTPG